MAYVLAAAAACGTTSNPAAGTPTPDVQATRAYVALAHQYWLDYKTAEGATLNDSSNQTAAACLEAVDPPTCARLGQAIVAVHQKFLADLGHTPAPSRFAQDDRVFRTQIPIAIKDLKSMIAAGGAGDRQAVVGAASAYVADMVPSVLQALDDVDPSITHV